MAEHARALQDAPGLTYYPYVEPGPRAGQGLLPALAQRACLVVGDDYPCFFLPRLLQAAGRALDVRLEAVDANGLSPLKRADRVHQTAQSFRRYLQKTLPEDLTQSPRSDPFKELPRFAPPQVSPDVRNQYPAADLRNLDAAVAALPIDHRVAPVAYEGGSAPAAARLEAFLENGLYRYEEARHPDAEATSGLSPYLHFGHISPHQVFQRLAEREGWFFDRLADRVDGRRRGWWGLPPPVEDFLDQLVTWRELGFNMTARRSDYHQYDSLPDWARRTLADHAADPRPYLYEREDFENAATHDPLWNAAQNQLLKEGIIHNYLRMLWGKKVLHWATDPQSALQIMIELNNKYALDGRDPNSYSGIFWVLGRYDHGWPGRAVFGKVRAMTSAQAHKKLRLDKYLELYGNKE
jgi:deoxyribodipyrimidine photo-lyase